MYKIHAIYQPREDGKFDFEHYFKVHVPLARKQHRIGGLNVLRMEVNTECNLLLEPESQYSPLTYSLYFESLEDIEAFREYLKSPVTEPLKEDVPKYTNCELTWTYCEVHELPPE